jgi:uracil-DNA glycosylase
MRITFVGQAPSRETDGKPPFTGKCGRFLAELLGITQEQMLKDFTFLNVLDRYPGKHPVKGDLFPMAEAKISARKKLEQLRSSAVVLLGNNVARAFGAEKFRYLELYEMRNPENFSDIIVPLMSVIPHPSQINRHRNRKENVDAVRKFLRHLRELCSA